MSLGLKSTLPEQVFCAHVFVGAQAFSASEGNWFAGSVKHDLCMFPEIPINNQRVLLSPDKPL